VNDIIGRNGRKMKTRNGRKWQAMVHQASKVTGVAEYGEAMKEGKREECQIASKIIRIGGNGRQQANMVRQRRAAKWKGEERRRRRNGGMVKAGDGGEKAEKVKKYWAGISIMIEIMMENQ